MGAIRANDFPRQADESGWAGGDHASLRTDPDDAERAIQVSTDQTLVPLARRRTGVKNGCGTARDAVTFLVRSRPRISLALGAGFLRGCSLLLRARGLDSSARPRFPGRYHLAG